ncbi:MAG: hypothetical protein U0930_26375 [Pirellulales bacterium]
MTDEPNLGNLAQAARGNQLNSARWTMIVIGLLTLAINGFSFVTAEKQIDDEIAKVRQPGDQIDMGVRNQVVGLMKLVSGGAAALGGIFIVLGVLVYKFPVPCTVAGLILYIVSTLGFAALDPSTLVRGIIIKIIIVFGLFKSVQSALAYQAEMKAQKNDPNTGGFSIN